MKTVWMLMAKYETPYIPAEVACKDFFAPLTYQKFLSKVSCGEIALPLVRMTQSQKSPRYVEVNDLAAFLDARTAEARREALALAR